MTTLLILQFVIPLVLLGWLGFARTSTRATWALKAVLVGGTHYVANGGSNQLMNPHLMTLTGERFRAWRGQSHGVDLVRLNAWGFRARGLKPRDPTRYAIFGDPVRAPCSGRVVQALDGLADLPPPQRDREHMAGNHVLLACRSGSEVATSRATRWSVAADDLRRASPGTGQGRARLGWLNPISRRCVWDVY